MANTRCSRCAGEYLRGKDNCSACGSILDRIPIKQAMRSRTESDSKVLICPRITLQRVLFDWKHPNILLTVLIVVGAFLILTALTGGA